MSKRQRINQGFILAAGFGKRMMPLTAAIPKPMVHIHGAPMIDHIINSFTAHGIERIIVNTHYQAPVLEDHLNSLKTPVKILISHEPDILETGGGIVNALPLMEKSAFFVSSGDSYLEEAQGKPGVLEALEAAWNPAEMDILILLQDISTMTMTQGVGDYDLDENGRAVRSKTRTGRYMFTSLRINAAHIFDDVPAGPFSYLGLLDKAEQAGRLYGIVHKGQWHHISTPQDVDAVNHSWEGQ